MKKLLPNQKAFIDTIFYGESYIIYHVDAYIRVYGLKRSSRRTHMANASRLFNKPHVQRYYKKVRAKRFADMWNEIEERNKRSHDETMNRIMSRGRA